MDLIIRVSQKLNSILFKGHSRSVRAKKNILASFAIKGCNILIGFVLVPLLIDYLNETKYGIWLTLTSLVAWFDLFDIGLGNGMKNKVAESLAKNDQELARYYVSTTYFALTLIVGLVLLVFFIAQNFIPWSAVFNAAPELGQELQTVALIVFGFFSAQFVIQLIGKLFEADQKPAISNVLRLIAQVLILVVVIILSKTTQDSLIYISLALMLIPLVVHLIASFYFYSGMYAVYRPSLKYVKAEYFRPLMSLGGSFFLIQVAYIVLYTTDSMIITRLLGPEHVTTYNIAYKYFNMVPVVFNMVMVPFWAAFTDAFTRGEVEWIKKIINKSLRLWMGIVFMVLCMIVLSPLFYSLWVGDRISVPLSLSIAMGVYGIIYSFTTIYDMFLNGVGKLRLSLYLAIFSMVVNIPLSYFFAIPLGMGLTGVIVATIVSILPDLVFRPIQFYKLVNGTASGIWNK